MKRGGSVRMGRRAHYPEVAGSNPALASITKSLFVHGDEE